MNSPAAPGSPTIRPRVRRVLRRRNLTRRDVAIRSVSLLIAMLCFGFGLYVAVHGPAS